MLESKFQKGGPGFITDHIMPTKTPVPFRGKHTPMRMPSSLASRVFKRLTHRVKPMMKVRDAMDKVYSKGYFQNHYPDADGELKQTLHKEAMVAHSRLRAQEEAPEEDHGLLGPKMSITINLG